MIVLCLLRLCAVFEDCVVVLCVCVWFCFSFFEICVVLDFVFLIFLCFLMIFVFCGCL